MANDQDLENSNLHLMDAESDSILDKLEETINLIDNTFELCEGETKDLGELIKRVEDPEAPIFMKILAAEAIGEMGEEAASAITILSESLHSDDEVLLEKVAEALGKIGKPTAVAVAALNKVAMSQNLLVHEAAINALEAMGEKTNALKANYLDGAEDLDDSVRKSSIEALGKIDQDSEIKQKILAAAKDSSAEVREKAIEAIGRQETNSEEEILLLIAALRDDDPSVRLEASISLGTKGKAALPHLVELLKTVQDPMIQYFAIEAIGHMGEDALDAVHILMKHIQEFTGVTRCSAVMAVGNILTEREEKDPESIKFLLAIALKDSEDYVREAASSALAKFGANLEVVLPVLVKGLHRGTLDVRKNVAQIVGFMGEAADSIAPHILRALNDKYEDVRNFAAISLVKVKGKKAKEAIPILVKVIHPENLGGDWALRIQAAKSLIVLGEKTLAVAALKEWLDIRESEIRVLVIEALADLGENAEPTIRKLIKLLGEDDYHVVSATTQTLAQLGHHFGSQIMMAHRQETNSEIKMKIQSVIEQFEV